MLKRYGALLLVICLSIALFSGCGSKKAETSSQDPQAEEIKKVALDYIQGWFEGDSAKVYNAIYENMVRRQVDADTIRDMDYNSFNYLVSNGGGKNVPRSSDKIEVNVLDVSNNIASVVVKSDYVDYLQLAKLNGKWVIVNILWDVNKQK